MIRIDSVEIEDFRGIRKLRLDLGRKNFGICGPNGSGKSGVVDAIEFALTGGITRLEGRGSLGLSVRAHGPHVDRTTSKTSKVRLAGVVVSLGKQFTIERSVDAPGHPIVTPADPKIEAVVSELAIHPEFALSRREIVKYIITTAGNRAKDVQELLRLDSIEKLRAALQRIANNAKREAKRAADDDERARRVFSMHSS
jgi:hypothetical protein